MGAHDQLGLFVGEQRGQAQVVIPRADGAVDVTGIVVRSRRQFRVETIDIFEERCRSIEPHAVDDDMAIIADPHVFTAQGDEALDIVCILNDSRDPCGFKDDDFPPPRPSEIVG